MTKTLASIAPKAGLTPKAARAKFRRLPKLRPFDHRKVKELNADHVKKALTFLKEDHRVNA